MGDKKYNFSEPHDTRKPIPDSDYRDLQAFVMTLFERRHNTERQKEQQHEESNQ